jgi:TPR repeat protein
MGIAIQTWRSGGSPGIISSALANPTLQQAERAFRNGKDDTAVAEFTKLANGNNPTAQYWLGHMTELGLGVSRNPAKAIALYKQAAAHKEVAAECRLGEIYMNGDLVPPDYSLAKSYLGEAAHQGNSQAAMLLGQMYGNGLGSTANMQEAYAWSEVSVLEGSATARQERASALKALSPDDQKAAITLAESLLTDIKHTATSQSAEG